MGQTAMHVAALWGHQEAIKVLVANGADVKATNSRYMCTASQQIACVMADAVDSGQAVLAPSLRAEQQVK